MKQRHAPPIVRLKMPTSDTPIPAAKQDTASTDAKLGEKRANGGGVVAWDGPLVVPIRGRSDGLGNRLLEGEEPIGVRFKLSSVEQHHRSRRTWQRVGAE